ncbi:hypothetical protein ACHAXA_006712 [Cyclostephanos tholiformis]|uniref:Glycosyl transferase CAP10 domain-containing protein n=1 Tax=Cyclostephanos tholiformis TaxID=382380 RepID=A0ABD3SRI1_9STRA
MRASSVLTTVAVVIVIVVASHVSINVANDNPSTLRRHHHHHHHPLDEAVATMAVRGRRKLLRRARRRRRRRRRRRLMGGLGLRSYLDPRTVVSRPKKAIVVRTTGPRSGGADDIVPSPTTTSSRRSSSSSSSSSLPPLEPYDVDDALLSVAYFRYTYFFFVYDSSSDAFVVVHNVPSCDYGCARIHRLANTLSYALRLHFLPLGVDDDDRDNSNNRNNDLVLMLSCGDSPRVKTACLNRYDDDGGGGGGGNDDCATSKLPPVLQFGSTYREYLPTLIAMPLPVRPHMPCFDEWQVYGTLCRDLLPMMTTATTTTTVTNDNDDAKDDNGGTDNNIMGAVDALRSEIKGGLPYGVELGIIPHPPNIVDDYRSSSSTYWDDLIPQVIWRGTDFHYLHTMYPNMRPPRYDTDIGPRLGGEKFANEYDRRRWAIRTLWGMGDDLLLPRWRGVLLTSEAELEADAEMLRQRGGGNDAVMILPWANIKFANVIVKGEKMPTSRNEDYLKLQELGISAIGEYVSMVEQARYKYHIDLGGGGGTTWTGTIEKLAMPGLLFHHVTPTKDWFHDLLVPWEHYVPVAADLSDLRRKYEWAESNPIEARRIAENGTRFARWMGSPEGFGRLYEEYLVAPLRNVIMAYRPMPPRDRQGRSRGGKSVLDVILESGEGNFKVVSRCTGLPGTSCEEM